MRWLLTLVTVASGLNYWVVRTTGGTPLESTVALGTALVVVSISLGAWMVTDAIERKK